MPSLNELRAALEAVVHGRADPAQCELVRAAHDRGDLRIERTATVGGDADDANIITGDGNTVIRIEAAALSALERALSPPVRAASPRRLPADLPDFEGRRVEIDELLGALGEDGGRAAVSAVGGMGGVGKSAFATHAAHMLAPRYPDGQLHIDLAGVRERPLTPTEAMAQVIRSFDATAALPDSEEAAAALYQTVLHGRRVLIVFDDAADAAQVELALRWLPATCGAIVTSRRTIILPGVRRVELGALAPEEARALLRSVLGPGRGTDAALDTLAEVCARLPLALRVAGTYLATYRDKRIDGYLKALADERERLRRLRLQGMPRLDVAAVLGLSAVRLAAEQPDLEARWCELAVFPADFDRPAAAAVWALPRPGDAEDALGELVARSMVLYDEDRDRYRLHDLMRDVARGPLRPDEDQAAREQRERRLAEAAARHAAHYQAVLASANKLYRQGGEATAAGLALYDLEQRNIAAGHAWALAQAAQDGAAVQLVASYPNGAPDILYLRLHPREQIRWHEAAAAAHCQLANRQGEANALGNAGLAYAALGEPRRAIELHEQDLAIRREIGDRLGEGNALGNLGHAHADLGEPRQAIELYEGQLAITHEIGDRRGEGNALGSLGIVHADLGEPRRAIELYEQWLAIAREIGDRQSEGSTLGNLGLAYAALGEPRRAIGLYKGQLEIAREVGDRRGEGNALGNSGLALDALGDRGEAIARMRAALRIYEEIEDPYAARARANLAEWGAEGA